MSHKQNVFRYVGMGKYSVAEIAKATGAPLDSVRRILNEYKDAGLATRNRRSEKWELTRRGLNQWRPIPVQAGAVASVVEEPSVDDLPHDLEVELDDELPALVDRDGDPIGDENTILLDEQAEGEDAALDTPVDDLSPEEHTAHDLSEYATDDVDPDPEV